MDALLLLNNMKWIIAELIRLNSNLSFDDTNDIINLVTEKEIDIIWEIDGKSRILSKNKNCKDQIRIIKRNVYYLAFWYRICRKNS